MMSFYETAFNRFIKPTIDGAVPGGAEDWALYTSQPGAAKAANELSVTLRKMLADMGQHFSSGMERLEGLMERHSDLGACDTEPRAELQHAVKAFLSYLNNEML